MRSRGLGLLCTARAMRVEVAYSCASRSTATGSDPMNNKSASIVYWGGDDHEHVRHRGLCERAVDLRSRLTDRSAVPDIGNDADDRAPLVGSAPGGGVRSGEVT